MAAQIYLQQRSQDCWNSILVPLSFCRGAGDGALLGDANPRGLEWGTDLWDRTSLPQRSARGSHYPGILSVADDTSRHDHDFFRADTRSPECVRQLPAAP